MPLSSLKVLELNEFLKGQGKLPLVEDLCERELNNPEGIELELRVGRVEKIVSGSFLGVKDRNSPETELIGDIKTDGNKKILMRSGDYFLVETIEKINCPAEKVKYDENFLEGYLMPNIFPRTSLQRSGISLHCSTTNPKYSGQ